MRQQVPQLRALCVYVPAHCCEIARDCPELVLLAGRDAMLVLLTALLRVLCTNPGGAPSGLL